MPWQRIERYSGDRANSGGVTVAWRATSSRSEPVLCVSISKDVTRLLKLQKDVPVGVELEPVEGLLRLTPGEAGGWRTNWRGDIPMVAVPLQGVTEKKKPAQAVPFRVEDGRLVLTLPDWAVPMRAGIRKAAQAAEQARARLVSAAA